MLHTARSALHASVRRTAARTFSSFVPSTVLTLDGAKVAMEAATAEASTNGWPVTIAVTDAGGVPIMLHRIGAAPFSAEVRPLVTTGASYFS